MENNVIETRINAHEIRTKYPTEKLVIGDNIVFQPNNVKSLIIAIQYELLSIYHESGAGFDVVIDQVTEIRDKTDSWRFWRCRVLFRESGTTGEFQKYSVQINPIRYISG